MSKHILAIDQGTTSSRAMVFDANMQMLAVAQKEFQQYFPSSGWVEHDGEEIWESVQEVAKKAIEKAGISSSEIAALGITNQRETTLLWDKETGALLHKAIVWQDRRTSDFCDQLREEGWSDKIAKITGLVIDPYFSATKLRWLLENVEGAREKAEAGKLAFGTIDSFLIWRLTGGKRHVTDATNAARTMLYDIRKNEWSKEICDRLDIPMNLLPEVLDCADDFGICEEWGTPVPIYGVAGDQQAATIGQACFEPGMLKSTYGTGCFALLNTGGEAVQSKNRLLTTIAYRLDGKTTYALEGSIFIAGAVVQWLRDGLKIIEEASETQKLAKEADLEQDVVFVPSFTGLGAPYWKAEARGAMFGLTRGTTNKELARAALESVGLQTRDLLEAMFADMGARPEAVLRVDGGMSASAYAMQFLSDLLDAEAHRPKFLETTILGVAWLAGMRAGLYPQKEEFAKSWALDCAFRPDMGEEVRTQKIENWQRAIKAVLAY